MVKLNNLEKLKTWMGVELNLEQSIEASRLFMGGGEVLTIWGGTGLTPPMYNDSSVVCLFAFRDHVS